MKYSMAVVSAAIVTGLALMLSHASAAPEPASDLPFFNVEKYCQHESEVFGMGNDSMLKFCLEQEQKSYDELKKKWDRVDNTVKVGCQPRGGLPSYY
jgi:hypothetical protein